MTAEFLDMHSKTIIKEIWFYKAICLLCSNSPVVWVGRQVFASIYLLKKLMQYIWWRIESTVKT